MPRGHKVLLLLLLPYCKHTPTHMAPEVLSHVSNATDVHPFEILLYKIISGRRICWHTHITAGP
jgi:hypothetical protein